MPRNFTINYARIIGAPIETPIDITLYYIVGHYETTTVDMNTYRPQQFRNENRSAFFISQPQELPDHTYQVTVYTDNTLAANKKTVTVPKVNSAIPTTSEIFSSLATQEELDVTTDKIFYSEDLRGQ